MTKENKEPLAADDQELGDTGLIDNAVNKSVEESTGSRISQAETKKSNDDADGKENEATDQPTQPLTNGNGSTLVELDDFVRHFKTQSYWNSWRRRQPERIALSNPRDRSLVERLTNLDGFQLNGMDLSGYDLSKGSVANRSMVGADLSGSILREADLSGSDLRRADFKRADLTAANFSETRLSGAVLDEETVFHTIKKTENVTVGINGIYVRRSSKRADEEWESAALMTLTPAGDSMKGNSADAVLENLKHARRLHTSSLILSAVVLAIVTLRIPTFKLSAFEGIELPVKIVAILSAALCVLYDALVFTHLRDAAEGAAFLQGREDAMKIALFPWGLSSYTEKRDSRKYDDRVVRFFVSWSKQKLPFSSHIVEWLFARCHYWLYLIRARMPRLLKEAIRFLAAFHTLLFFGAGINFYRQNRAWYSLPDAFLHFKPAVFLLLVATLLIISLLIYIESLRFRRPIVFDAETERAPQTDLSVLASSIAEQLQVTKRLASFIETALPRYQNAGDQIVDRLPDGVEVVLRRLPAGSFKMGSAEDASEQPVEPVSVRQFWISPYAVTQQLWVSVIGGLPAALPDDVKFKNPRFPVIHVSWHDATDFCRRLNALLGLSDQYGYRLPTEAEWEYAARAGSITRFCFGDDEAGLAEYGWYAKNSNQGLHVVGDRTPNQFGLYDMHGNVWEWCQDHWHDDYQKAPRDGTAWVEDDGAASRVFRGGGWLDRAVYCRSAIRYGLTPGDRAGILGFRLSRTLP